MRFVASRTITVAGFAADANPNITAPTADKIYTMKERNITGRDTAGLGLVVVFAKTSAPGTFEDDTAAASVAFTQWVKDSTTSGWVRMTSDTATHRLFKTSADVRGPADLFTQVTAISSNPASATSFTVSYTEE